MVLKINVAFVIPVLTLHEMPKIKRCRHTMARSKTMIEFAEVNYKPLLIVLQDL